MVEMARRARYLAGGVIILAGLMAGWLPAAEAQAPPNLLGNPGLEGPYYGQGTPNQTVPQGWGLWVGQGTPESLPDSTQVREGNVAWAVQQSDTAFTAAGYQQVTVTPGAVLQASVWAQVFTCDDLATACAITDPPYRQSDQSAAAQLLVGIDPQGGSDPLAEWVQWSPVFSPYDDWVELSVTATAERASVTMFLYMTQAQGLALNAVYWDNASLIVTELAPTPTPPPTEPPTLTPTTTLTAPPTLTPTITPTPTPLSVADAAPELVASGGELCVTLFDDANTNGLYDEAESTVAGAFDLIGPDGAQTTHEVDAGDEPLCLQLVAAQYQVRAQLPELFGPTTPDEVAVTLVVGRRIDVAFGGASGNVLPTIPPGTDDASAAAQGDAGLVAPTLERVVEDDNGGTPLEWLYSRSGLVVLALAGVLAVGSLFFLVYLNRPRYD
jgi:hypothetical protein